MAAPAGCGFRGPRNATFLQLIASSYLKFPAVRGAAKARDRAAAGRPRRPRAGARGGWRGGARDRGRRTRSQSDRVKLTLRFDRASRSEILIKSQNGGIVVLFRSHGRAVP